MNAQKFKAQDRREQIITIALEVFSEKGYRGAVTREIARAAGINEVTLFRYFHRKELLFRSVIERYSFLPKFKELVPKLDTMSYRKALKAIAEKFLDVLEERKAMVKIMHSEAHLYPQEARIIYRELIDKIFKQFNIFLEKRIQAGEVREIDSYLSARCFFGMFFSHFIKNEIYFKDGKKSRDKVIETYTDIFVRGTAVRK